MISALHANRPTGWLRPLLTLAALAGVLSLAACGGGGGAPNNPYQPGAGPLTVLPATANVYSDTPVTLSVSGGTAPYSVFSSDQGVLPVQADVAGNSLTLIPDIVTADTPVTLTFEDSAGHSTTASLTVKAGLLVNAMTLKPDNFSTSECPSGTINSTTPTDTNGSTWICSGQTGSIAVRLQNGGGGGVAGQMVRFDVIQGDFEFFTELPQQPPTFASTYAVPTDQNGNAVARVEANPAAPQQIVIVQATVCGAAPLPDCAAGPPPTAGADFVRGLFVIQQFPGGITVVPSTLTITGANNQVCSAEVTTTFYIFGGEPPYRISNPFPQALQVSPLVVAASGNGFNVTTTGLCVDPATLAITDAAGHQTTVTVINQLGTAAPGSITSTNPITIAPTTIPTLVCGQSTSIFATGGGTRTQTGTTQTITPATSFNTAAALPAILSVTPSTVSPGSPIQIQRQNGGTVDGTQPGGATVNAQVFISDSGQTKTVLIPVQNTCP